MIKVTVEIIPFGDVSRKQTLGIAIISNDGTGNKDIGNYEYVIGDVDFEGNLIQKIQSRFEGHNRDESAWKLLAMILTKEFHL